MRESKGAWSPRSYAVLARAQLELRAPVADIARTLDEYAELLERTEFRLFEGELHQLRARLANREGRHVERAAALNGLTTVTPASVWVSRRRGWLSSTVR